MVYQDFKDFTRKIDSKKAWPDKTINITKNPKYDEYQNEIISIVFKLFDKESTDTSTQTRTGINCEKQNIAKEWQKPIIRKFRKCKGYSSFKNKIWGADLEHTQLTSKCNNWIWILSSAIDIFSKCICFKHRKSVIIPHAFQKNLEES